MSQVVSLPIWLFVLILLFAAVTAMSHFLIPSVRWFFRRRMERVVERINSRLDRPIEPFKLARRHDMIQQLIYHPDVMSAVTEHAAEEGMPENVAFEEARRYAREIVPSFSATAYFTMANWGCKVISQAFYRVRLGHYDKTLGDIGSDKTVVFVMNHRSNMDYVLVTYLAAQRSALSYAVGEWARVWPLSRVIRSMGAYFIRRKSRGLLYRRVLARYVQMATQNGVTQAIFPEGGLSLDGRMAPPKMGLLNYVVSAWERDGRDVVFVPVAINYDRVLEDYILVGASKRGDRRFGASIGIVTKFILDQVWLRLTRRYTKFGYAAASFGEPLSLADFAKDADPDVEDIAVELMRRIGVVVPVLPVPLVSAALVREGAMTRETLDAHVLGFMDQFKEGHVHVPRDDAEYAVEVGVRNLVRRALIAEENGMVSITEKGKDIVPYYAAGLEHLF